MYLQRIEARLAEIASENRLRSIQREAPSGLDFSNNDYLGLATDSRVVQAFHHAKRVGAGGARLLGGRSREHALLEDELAHWLGRERALLFSSGYLAALGAIPVLASVSETIYSDSLNHASLIDGIRASGIERKIYPHNETPRRAERRGASLVISESLFSMDGDTSEPSALLQELGENDVLLLDEAHALGLYGPEGGGLARSLDDPRILILGTLAKSLGAQGGFIAGPASAIELIVNSARTFIFDSALPPAIALAARVALTILRSDEERRLRLRANARHLRSSLASIGLTAIGDEASPIVPIVLGDELRALEISERLRSQRIAVPAIRPPTVPRGSSRLRISLRSNHEPEQIDLLIRELQRCLASS